MRSIWKGAVSFGMVTIPVKLYGAVEDRDIRLHLLHATDLAPIQEKRFCTAEDVEVPWADVVRGYEVAKGEYVAITPAELEEVAPESAHTIEIGDFVELEEIDPVYFEKSYFLEPEDVGAKPFLLLKQALDETGRIAVARVTIRTKERLATVRVYDATLVLETMYWPDEIRPTSQLDLPDEGGRTAPSSHELQMARSLVENLSTRFDPASYQDRYRLALQELIERKTKGEARNARRRKPAPRVTDLMAALQASVEQARAARDGGSTAATDGRRAHGRGAAGRGAAGRGAAPSRADAPVDGRGDAAPRRTPRTSSAEPGTPAAAGREARPATRRRDAPRGRSERGKEPVRRTSAA
ncbi:MAG TPA: Ku protein [Candidatus Limnocylindrales bacterium]